MSKEVAKAFFETLGRDAALMDQVGRLAPDDMPGLLEIARGAGFGSFTREEYWRAVSEAGGPASAQLSDVDLQAVAGGMMPLKTAGHGCKTGKACWGF